MLKTIEVEDQSVTLESVTLYLLDRLTGKRAFQLEFRCPHKDVEVCLTDVHCYDCNNEDMSDDDREGFLGY